MYYMCDNRNIDYVFIINSEMKKNVFFLFSIYGQINRTRKNGDIFPYYFKHGGSPPSLP